MNAHHQLFGLHIPTGSWVHRLPAWVKLLVAALTTIPAVLLRDPWLSAGQFSLAVALLLASRVPWRRAFPLPWLVWMMVAMVSAYPLLFGEPIDALVTGLNLVGSMYLGRVITVTTPAMDLVDTLMRLAAPLNWVGIGAERFGMAAMIMLRSVPYLVDSATRVGQSARARGLQRHLFARVTPVVIDAVGYAHRTGEALVARGLGDGEMIEDEPGTIIGHHD